jgi:hypothetical protein
MLSKDFTFNEVTTKKSGILDSFKPSRNWKKLSGKRFRRFFLDGFKPSSTMGRQFGLRTIGAKPSVIPDDLGKTVQNFLDGFAQNCLEFVIFLIFNFFF